MYGVAVTYHALPGVPDPECTTGECWLVEPQPERTIVLHWTEDRDEAIELAERLRLPEAAGARRVAVVAIEEVIQ